MTATEIVSLAVPLVGLAYLALLMVLAVTEHRRNRRRMDQIDQEHRERMAALDRRMTMPASEDHKNRRSS